MGSINDVPLSLHQISEGRCEGVLLFKVDRVFFPQIIHCLPDGKSLKEMVSVDLVVYDRSVSSYINFFFLPFEGLDLVFAFFICYMFV